MPRRRETAESTRAVKRGGTKFEISKELSEGMVTGKLRLSYVHLLEPWSGDEEKEGRYSTQCIVDKDDPWLKEAKLRVKNIAVEAFGPTAPKLLRSGRLKQPFRDGDEEFPDDENYAGKVFFNANGVYEGKKPPGLVDPHMRDIRKMDSPEDLCYSGMYARVSVKFYPYDQKGGRGVGCFLNHVQFWEHGEPLAGGPSVDSVFSEIEDAEDPFADKGGFDDDEDWM